MLDQEILDILKSIKFKLNAIKELHLNWKLNITSLKHYGIILEKLVKKLNEKIEKYY